MDVCIFVKPAIKKIVKGKVPCQSVSNKLEVYNFPSDFRGIRKLEKVLIAKKLLFKKIAIMPHGQMEKISGTICNNFQSILLMSQICYHDLPTAMG